MLLLKHNRTSIKRGGEQSGMAQEVLARERGTKSGEVILYRTRDGRYRVYRDIPGVGAERDTGSDYFSQEYEAWNRYEELCMLLKRLNTPSIRDRSAS